VEHASLTATFMELEVIAFDLASCRIAEDNGANRIELCANPHEGGTTPSYGMIATARESTNIQLFPIIRPRGGDFLYTRAEFESMATDVRQSAQLGCDGVVIGMLHKDGRVDVDRCAELVGHAGGMEVTFHRAFDRVSDPITALEEIIELGCSRILTSGLRPNVDLGKAMLRTLVKAAGRRITIMPGSGVRAGNIAELARFTGARAFHSSARTVHDSVMQYTNPAMDEDLHSVSLDPTEVSELRRILDADASGLLADR
jgi:copper homeostasis protein